MEIVFSSNPDALLAANHHQVRNPELVGKLPWNSVRPGFHQGPYGVWFFWVYQKPFIPVSESFNLLIKDPQALDHGWIHPVLVASNNEINTMWLLIFLCPSSVKKKGEGRKSDSLLLYI